MACCQRIKNWDVRTQLPWLDTDTLLEERERIERAWPTDDATTLLSAGYSCAYFLRSSMRLFVAEAVGLSSNSSLSYFGSSEYLEHMQNKCWFEVSGLSR